MHGAVGNSLENKETQILRHAVGLHIQCGSDGYALVGQTGETKKHAKP